MAIDNETKLAVLNEKFLSNYCQVSIDSFQGYFILGICTWG